ncbi:MAG TPA: hypothetical protein VN830_00730 [Verrucomicrobiae bacterium]|nr:hypothetical protein [Verrucomicrobiae bacterium]
MRLENLSLRQVAIAVPILGLVNWAIFLFAFLPKMTEQDRKGIYAGWMSTPYPYAGSIALICAAIWFVFLYRGSYSTQGRRVAAFAMALGASCGMLIILVIRITWHI